jgi:hypothetical protein
LGHAVDRVVATIAVAIGADVERRTDKREPERTREARLLDQCARIPGEVDDADREVVEVGDVELLVGTDDDVDRVGKQIYLAVAVDEACLVPAGERARAFGGDRWSRPAGIRTTIRRRVGRITASGKRGQPEGCDELHVAVRSKKLAAVVHDVAGSCRAAACGSARCAVMRTPLRIMSGRMHERNLELTVDEQRRDPCRRSRRRRVIQDV